jgi:hypothetical protein
MYRAIDYYEPLAKATALKQVERGQFWWTFYPYAFNQTKFTRFWPDRPTETVDVTRFDPEKEQPDAKAGTEPGEFLAVAKFKRRPVVILSIKGTEYAYRAWRGGEFFLVAPSRTLRNSLTGEYKAPPQFVWEAITYKYSPIFYLPRSDEFGIQEGVLHFDRITAVHHSWLLTPCKARLRQEAMICLDEWLRNYIYGKVRLKFNKDLEAYREMVGNDPQIRTGVFGKDSI